MPLADIISPSVRLNQIIANFQVGTLSLTSDAVLIVLGFLYLWGTRKLARRQRHWSNWRTLSFFSGLGVIFFATGSGFAGYDDTVFYIHVIQHLLLMNAAPIFLVLSAPVTLLLQASVRPVKTRALRVINSRIINVLTMPIVTWLGNWLTMYVYFLTPVYALSLKNPLFHDYTHLQFLVAGYLYWSTVMAIDPLKHKLSFGAKLIFLLSGIPFGSFLGVAITQKSSSIAPFAHTLSDTHLGGSILWAFGELFTLAALAIIFFQWARNDEREARRIDRELYP